MPIGREGNVKWVDGLRGIASVLVLLTHICRAFDGNLFVPADGEHATPRLLQWPYLRILAQGRLGVTIFSFVTGYVCALKPLRLYRQGNQEAGFAAVSKSALRRFPRLALPAALATVICWIAAGFGFFEVAHHCDAWWVHDTSPPGKLGFGWKAIKDLIYWIVGTWVHRRNIYDNNQWTMLPLLTGSFSVYAFVVATAYVKPHYRMILSMVMWGYYYCCRDSAFGMQFFFGVFICDLQHHPSATQFLINHPKISRVLAVIFMFLGLTIASYPEQKPEWQPWSAFLHSILVPILPRDPDYPRFSSGFGLELMSLGIHFSPWLREGLSTRPLLWLGKQSFAVYLLHGTLLRVVLAWMLYGIRVPPVLKNEKGEFYQEQLRYPGHRYLLLCLIFWIPMVYGVSMLWTHYVDPWCARVTERMVERIKLDSTEKKPVLPN